MKPGPLIIDLEGDLALTPADRARLQHPAVGGVILFRRNHAGRAQLRALTAAIKGLRSPALLITVDQEGGRVQRFRDGFTRLPAAARCGRRYDRDAVEGERLARALGLVMAAELIACGVDLSFAPVLDVLSRDSRVIGDRAFHSDAGAVQRLASACIHGMHDAGMGAVGKHFPGHGGVEADSHTCLPEDSRPMAALRGCDLQPYAGLHARLQGVMLAHVRYARIEPWTPSYSGFWVQEVLRGDIGFRGAVFSDDLTMAGAGDEPLAERCRAALAAGCDLLPICNDIAAVDQLLAAWDHRPQASSTPVINHLYATPEQVDEHVLLDVRRRLEAAASEAGPAEPSPRLAPRSE